MEGCALHHHPSKCFSVFFVRFSFYLLCARVLCQQVCLCIMHMQCLQKPEEGVGLSGIRVTDGVSYSVGVRNWTRFFWKSSTLITTEPLPQPSFLLSLVNLPDPEILFCYPRPHSSPNITSLVHWPPDGECFLSLPVSWEHLTLVTLRLCVVGICENRFQVLVQ